MTNSAELTKSKLSLRKQTLAAVLAVIAAVALPQLLHFMGRISGLGTALGEMFLPMHFPVLLVGLIAGPYAGAAAGILSPLISAGLTGMPGTAMLPFMMLELCAYGLFSGLLRNTKLPCIAKVIIAQIAGRAVRAAAILISVYAIGNSAVPAAVIWKSIAVGIFGLAIQWIMIPLIMYRLNNEKMSERE